MSQNVKPSLPVSNLASVEPRALRESIRFAIVGFFFGNFIWISSLGMIALVRLFASFIRNEAFSNTINSAMDSLTYALDWSDLLVPVVIAALFFLWRYSVRGRPSIWLMTFINLFKNSSAIVGLLIVGMFGLVANFADPISPYHPETDLLLARPRLEPCVHALGCEGDEYLFGLDLNGRDLFSRVIWGTRNSIPVGVIAVAIAIFFGVLIGLTAGYFGGWWDNIVMRIMDVLLAFPSLLLSIAIVTVLGPGLQNALIAISIVSIPTYARLTRASVLSVKELEFITAEHALGANHIRIMFQQILPNTMTPIVVQGTLGVGTAVLDAAALSFLGLGAQPPAPEWGQMLSESINYVTTSPHMVFFPGIAIMLTVLGFNLLGDGLRDALDPRLNQG